MANRTAIMAGRIEDRGGRSDLRAGAWWGKGRSAGGKRDRVVAAPQAAWGPGPWAARGARLGYLTERHLIHGPLFLHAGHWRRLLLILCGQRMRLKPRGIPGGRGGAGSARGRGQRACASASGAVRGRGRGGASPPAESGRGPLPPVLCPLTTLLLPGGD